MTVMLNPVTPVWPQPVVHMDILLQNLQQGLFVQIRTSLNLEPAQEPVTVVVHHASRWGYSLATLCLSVSAIEELVIELIEQL